MTQTATRPPTTNPEPKSRLANLDWRRYVIYIGFVIVFLFFAITLGGDGFLIEFADSDSEVVSQDEFSVHLTNKVNRC